ncbi:hypothetical protein [Sandaracinus amylolyticus]|uniref:hypothetical protein n=1 Tax=Sandaracinus amylolyticus TaxID=927083 RepID=UPI001F36F55E|nr:hypothetical protein [Sandaracinus amylolyticus]UJR86696.1 Hypothetical protein I5071_87970 [Sandaracinus amylolyticus]
MITGRVLSFVSISILALGAIIAGCKPATSGDGRDDAGSDGCASSAECDDDNECTRDVCLDGVCENTAREASCDDGIVCNGTDECEGGECVHSGDPCEAPTTCDEQRDLCVGCESDDDCPAATEGDWSDCEFAETCDVAGTRERHSRRFACTEGACVPDERIESEECTRDTEGTACAPAGCGEWSECGGFADACDGSGEQTRTCTESVCAGGTCSVTERTETQACVRDTEGDACADPECDGFTECAYDHACDDLGTRSRTCRPRVCAAGACVLGTAYADAQTCNRVTEGTQCAPDNCGAYGECDYSDDCDDDASRERSCQSTHCQAGACVQVRTRVDVEACSRDQNGRACDDGDPCTIIDRCRNGWCEGQDCSSCCGGDPF